MTRSGMGWVLGMGVLLAVGRWATAPGAPVSSPSHRPAQGDAARRTVGQADGSAEIRASAFEEAVLRELEGIASGAGDAHEPAAPVPDAARLPRSARMRATDSAVVPAGARDRDVAIESLIASGEIGSVDWEYLEDVFAGRVQGIPNERRAGIRLPVMDALGTIPHVEKLRREGRVAELARLGLGPVRTPPVVLNPRLRDLVEARLR